MIYAAIMKGGWTSASLSWENIQVSIWMQTMITFNTCRREGDQERILPCRQPDAGYHEHFPS